MSAAPRFSTADIARRAERTDLVGPVTPEAPKTPEITDAAVHGNAQAAAAATATEARRAERIEEEAAAPLFAADAAEGFQRRWDTIQASFVDDPRRAVEEADALVAETMQRLAESFAQQREQLERQLGARRNAVENRVEDSTSAAQERVESGQVSSQGGQASTEDLRIALRHYRSFFKRLLSV